MVGVSELSFCTEADRVLLRSALDAIVRGLGEKVRAVMMVGPAVPPARHEGASALELLIVVSELPVPALSNLAHQASDALGAGVRMRLLTERELLRSADVFTLELAEARSRHVLLHGSEPFDDLYFTAEELRRSIEQALRRLARELRQMVLAAVGDPAAGGCARQQVEEAVDGIAVVAAHAFSGAEPPRAACELELIRGLAERAQIDPNPLLQWVHRLRAGEPVDDPVPLLAELLAFVEAAASLVDRWGAAD